MNILRHLYSDTKTCRTMWSFSLQYPGGYLLQLYHKCLGDQIQNYCWLYKLH